MSLAQLSEQITRDARAWYELSFAERQAAAGQAIVQRMAANIRKRRAIEQAIREL